MEGIAQRIVYGDVPSSMAAKKVLSVDLGLLVAGAGVRGEFEQRLKSLLAAVQADPSIILFIDEAHMIIGLGQAGGEMDASNLLKPALARGDLHCIAATTVSEFKANHNARTHAHTHTHTHTHSTHSYSWQAIEKNPALARRFQKVQVDEPTVEATLAILRYAAAPAVVCACVNGGPILMTPVVVTVGSRASTRPTTVLSLRTRLWLPLPTCRIATSPIDFFRTRRLVWLTPPNTQHRAAPHVCTALRR